MAVVGVPVAVAPVAVVWFTVAVVTLGALAAVLLALVRHALVVARAGRRLADEVGEVQAEVAWGRERASGASGPRRRRRSDTDPDPR